MDLLRISYLTHWQAVLVCLLLGCSLSLSKQRNYNGDKVLRVKIANQKEWETVESIMKKYTVEDDIWSHPVTLPSFGDIRVSQHEFSPVTSQLTEHGLNFEVFIENVQDFVNAEKVQSNTKSKPFRRKRATMSNRIIGTYASFDDIVDYIYNAEKNFEIASVTKIGESTEGRPLLVLKLGVPHPDPKVVKPVIWIDAGIHAREWIAPASIMYIIYQLLNGYHEKDPVIFDLIKRIDWMFLPVVNPDGYIYSHSDERLWRKNRVKINGTDCIGVDLNRNFAFHWGEETASADPCHVMFRGVAAGSENETQHVQNFLMANRENIYVYISLHSYSQYWFSRWAYTPERVDTHDEMLGLAERAVKEINKVNNQFYEAGLSHQFMYGYSGGSPDWAHGVAKIPYSYTVELRDRGRYGFVLPQNLIQPSGEEMTVGLLVVGQYIKNVSGIMNTFPDKDNVTSSFDGRSPSGVNSTNNATETTLPPFVFTEPSNTTQAPLVTPSRVPGYPDGLVRNNEPPRGRQGPREPPYLQSDTIGGRDQIRCTGECLRWWTFINQKASRLPLFYRRLFSMSGRFGPWRSSDVRPLLIWS